MGSWVPGLGGPQALRRRLIKTKTTWTWPLCPPIGKATLFSDRVLTILSSLSSSNPASASQVAETTVMCLYRQLSRAACLNLQDLSLACYWELGALLSYPGWQYSLVRVRMAGRASDLKDELRPLPRNLQEKKNKGKRNLNIGKFVLACSLGWHMALLRRVILVPHNLSK